jgi:restriction system protein
LKTLRDKPRLLHSLTPRKFEFLIAELLKRDGWEIEVTPASRDGGKDVIATLRTSGICSVYYIECKRYAPKQPVSVKAVRELLGIVHAKRVTAGMLVTTSGFTRSARDLQSIEPHRITLKAYTDVVAWLKAARQKGTDNVS